MSDRQTFYAFRMDSSKYRYHLRLFPDKQKFFIFCTRQTCGRPAPHRIAIIYTEAEQRDEAGRGAGVKVLVVEPMKPCYVREISGLNDMQEIVGGHIEAIYPFKEQVAIIANEEGKILGLPFNRPLSDERGVPYDIVCGTFFMAGLGK